MTEITRIDDIIGGSGVSRGFVEKNVDDWESEPCVACGSGDYYYEIVDCACHISPPCHACENAELRCTYCGEEPPIEGVE